MISLIPLKKSTKSGLFVTYSTVEVSAKENPQAKVDVELISVDIVVDEILSSFRGMKPAEAVGADNNHFLF